MSKHKKRFYGSSKIVRRTVDANLVISFAKSVPAGIHVQLTEGLMGIFSRFPIITLFRNAGEQISIKATQVVFRSHLDSAGPFLCAVSVPELTLSDLEKARLIPDRLHETIAGFFEDVPVQQAKRVVEQARKNRMTDVAITYHQIKKLGLEDQPEEELFEAAETEFDEATDSDLTNLTCELYSIAKQGKVEVIDRADVEKIQSAREQAPISTTN